MEISKFEQGKLRYVLTGVWILAACLTVPFVSPVAQRRSKEKPPKVTEITSRKVAGGDVISLSADSALDGIQTWQDPNGSFHLVLPGSGESDVKASPKGVSVRRVGNSLEIEVQTRRGSSVTIEPRFNRLELLVNGGIDTQTSSDNSIPLSPVANASNRTQAKPASPPALAGAVRPARNSNETARKPEAIKKQNVPSVNTLNLTPPASPPNTKSQSIANDNTTKAPSKPAVAPAVPAPAENASSEPTDSELAQESTLSNILGSLGWISLLLVGVLTALIIWRKREKAGWVEVDADTPAIALAEEVELDDFSDIVGDRRDNNRRQDGRTSGRRSHDHSRAQRESTPRRYQNGNAPVKVTQDARPTPAILYGAYRVDQEVGKLVLGQPHRMDVLASRSQDDRLSMEASLLKALRSVDTDEDGRRRARLALEDYGFVARQSAAVLLGRDACERVSAARVLGEVGSAGAIQFLLEALYDVEASVRNQAVESIGALKLPSAIGALLDIARRYPDMPTSVLSNALNACSIECMDIFDSSPKVNRRYLSAMGEPFSSDIVNLDPSPTFQELPATADDEVFQETMSLLKSENADSRATAAQTLAIYRVQDSVLALKQMAATDPEPAVRTSAVASLGAIDHESVFSTVLVGLADEARDVRAAAARAVSRLSFDRADAYARVIETSDEQELGEVANACIKTGMAAQALDRLSSDDRRQAYEAYSLLSLLAKANQCQPILDVIESHHDLKACTAAIQLLGLSGSGELVPRLKELAQKESMPEQLKTAINDSIDKLDQMQLA